MKKGLKILLIVLVIIAILIIGFICLVRNLLSNFETGKPVSDYDKKIEIWGETIPYNNNNSKLVDMKINKDENVLSATLNFATAIVGNVYNEKAEENIDTFTYLHGIKGGYEKETYEDVPYIIPYLVNNSDSAVIVIPGGGYGYKSMDGEDGEGKVIAEELNKNGINAFVLWYRSNPYERPVPQLDLQRAVRYIRYHSQEFGIDKNKISMIGFSAGGNQVGSYINLIEGNDFLPSNYIKDEIDLIDDKVTSGAMIYPALSYNENVNMLFASYDSEKVKDERTRNELLKENDLIVNFNSSNVSQFVAYGTKDGMVGMNEAKRYIVKAKEQNTDIIEISAEGQDHGFKIKYYFESYIKWLKRNLKK